MGGKIKISGRTITVRQGKSKKVPIIHEIIFDRIEAGTYMIASKAFSVAPTEILGNFITVPLMPFFASAEIYPFLIFIFLVV